MKWINPKTGELERRPPGVLYSYLDDYNPYDPTVREAGQDLLRGVEVPGSIQSMLDKSAQTPWDGEALKASSVGWRDTLTPRRVLIADGAQILNVTAETIMVPDFTFAADYLEVGDVLKYTLYFDWSSVITTPGNFTLRLRWGGVGGVSLVASGAYAPDPTAAGTNISGMVEFLAVCRSTGTTGSMYCMGNMFLQDIDDATVTTIKDNLNMTMLPVSAPAVASIDTTIAKALSPTFQSSVATATTQLTNHIAILESLN